MPQYESPTGELPVQPEVNSKSVTNRFGIAAICSIRPAFSLSPAPFLGVREELRQTLGARERALSGAVL